MALYNSPSKPMQRADGKTFIEVIRPGAFRDTLRDGHNIYALNSHDRDAVLGSTQAGTLNIREDATGLYVEITLPDTQTGKDLKTLLSRGEPMGGSFCANIDAWKWGAYPQGNALLCELLALELMEVTITAFPAYSDTSIVLRSNPPIVRPPKPEENEIYAYRLRLLNL